MELKDVRMLSGQFYGEFNAFMTTLLTGRCVKEIRE